MLKLNKVKSTRIDAIGYDNNILYVLFHKGGAYKYNNVPKDVYRVLITSDSIGKAFNSLILETKEYKCEKIKLEPSAHTIVMDDLEAPDEKR